MRACLDIFVKIKGRATYSSVSSLLELPNFCSRNSKLSCEFILLGCKSFEVPTVF